MTRDSPAPAAGAPLHQEKARARHPNAALLSPQPDGDSTDRPAGDRPEHTTPAGPRETERTEVPVATADPHAQRDGPRRKVYLRFRRDYWLWRELHLGSFQNCVLLQDILL